MLVKWIVCKVSEPSQAAFSQAQSRWGLIREATGFMGQHGGWDLKGSPPDACIVGAWQDPQAYASFMATLHDRVTEGNGQADSYTAIRVDLCEVLLPMQGVQADPIQGIQAGAAYLRIAECQVRPERVEHFVQAQASVWIPAMGQTPGMYGGWFLRSRSEPARFVVLTAWASEAEHQDYASRRVPGLRQEADVTADVIGMTGRFVRLEPAWSVSPGPA